MNDFKRLEEKLAKLGDRGSGATVARTLSGHRGEDRLASLVREIDEIILPREVRLTDDAGPVLTLAAGSRRLQALVPPVPGDLSDLTARPLPGDDETLLRVRDALVTRLDAAGSIEVRSDHRGTNTFPAESGVPVSVLARAWDIDVRQSDGGGGHDPLSALEGFLGAASPKAIAWIRIDGETVSGQGGDNSALGRIAEHLAGFVDSFLAKRDALDLPPDRVCALAVAGPEAGQAAVLADHGDSLAVLICASKDAPDLLSDWRAAVAG